MSCQPCCDRCGACAGDCRCAGACGQVAALEPPVNRPGLAALDARLGDHAAFFAAARASLSSPEAPALRLLGTRALSDPSIAWLDAWALAADVLTFYRERWTNEGYLRTATEERSLRELAAGIGYVPRPGIAASVHLAYALDPTAAPIEMAAGMKAQTVPQPGEQMQTFETSEPLFARAEWSEIAPRQGQVPAIDRLQALLRATLRLDDPTLSVRPGERLLLVFGQRLGQQVVREVADARADMQKGFVELTLKPKAGLVDKNARFLLREMDRLVRDIESAAVPAEEQIEAARAVSAYLLGGSPADSREALRQAEHFEELVEQFDAILSTKVLLKGSSIKPHGIDDVAATLGVPPSAQLRSGRLLSRSAVAGMESEGSKRASLMTIASPQLGDRLFAAWRNLAGVAAPLDKAPQVFLMRTTTTAFGGVAPKLVKVAAGEFTQTEHPLDSLDKVFAFLDSIVDAVQPDSFVLIDSPRSADADTRTVRLALVRSTQATARGDYGISSKVTRLELVDPQTSLSLTVPLGKSPNLAFLRNTTYSVNSQRVRIAADPISAPVGGSTIELDRLYDGLDSGRWIIVSGERADIKVRDANNDEVVIPGVLDGELAMIAGVAHASNADSPGDVPHTVLTLAQPLAYQYKRAASKIYGNVVPATHGETVTEVIGSGDATVSFARFALRRAPLTFVPAVTTSGVRGSQSIRANGAKLRQVESLLDAGASDRVYQLDVDGAGGAGVVFGDGTHGAPAPTGQENIRAIYRVGIGKPGNVKAEQISLLASRPLGVRNVLNPLPASGGADRDGPESIRANAPLAALALSPLSRLVSVGDYEYFARRFAGIGHARAQRLSDGRFECVHVTLAGVDDIPLTQGGDLVSSLRAAYDAFGDPALPVVIGIRELVALFVQARVALRSDADEDVVVPALRRTLLERFSFSRRRLAQPAYLSEVVAALHSVRGVDWVDVDVFGGISEVELRNPAALAKALAVLQKQAAGGAVATVVDCTEAVARIDAPKDRADLAAADAGGKARFLAAQLGYLVASVPDTLVINIVQAGSRS